jgi:hypothetical protein
MNLSIRTAAVAFIHTVLLAGGVGAQAAPIDFDKLPRKEQPAKRPVARDTVVATRKSPTAAPRVPVAVAAAPVRHVDTVIVSRVDTLRLERIDTVKLVAAPSHAPTPQAAAAPAVTPPTFAVAGLLQVMFSGGDAVRTTYRLRRVELKVTSDLGKRAQAVMMVDAAKALALNTTGAQPAVTQSSRMLQDAFITVPIRRVTIDAGQQRLPLGYEGAMSASGLETIERALMESDKSRGAAFGDVRDAGVAVRQSWSAVDYRVGVFNGSGESMNDLDKQAGKAVVGMLAFHPKKITGLRIGASAATSGSGAGDNPVRDRVGADLRVLGGPVALQLEGMTGQDGSTRRLGGYALVTVAARARLKLVARVDAWDPDRASNTTAASVVERDYLGGFTWLPAGTRLKLQLNLVHKTYSAGLVPSSTLILSQLQASW